jgi:hypothetical protein
VKRVEIGARFKLWVIGEKEKRVAPTQVTNPARPPAVDLSNVSAYSDANPAIVCDTNGNWSIFLHYDKMNNLSSSRIRKSWGDVVGITSFSPSVSQGCMPGPILRLQNNAEGHLREGRI